MTDFFSYLDSPQFIKGVILAGVCILIAIGLFALMKKKNLIKVFMSIAVIEAAVNILIVCVTFDPSLTAPIVTNDLAGRVMGDPIPQALVLTSIVIGVAVLALGIYFSIKYYELTGKTNISQIRDLKR